MKMLFFSSEPAEIEEVRKSCIDAGIACEVHGQAPAEGPVCKNGDTELWIQNDLDSYRAWLLCVKLGVGFARRSFGPGTERNGREHENDEG